MKHAVWVTTLVALLIFDVRTSSADVIAPHANSGTTIFDRGMKVLIEAHDKMWTQPRPFVFDASPKNEWLGTHVRLTLLARNRGGTSRLLGEDGRSAIDFASLRRSTRMGVARLTLGDGIIQPFAQIGFGAWRKDIDRHWRGDQWFGGQSGGGVQVRLFERFSVAAETDYGVFGNPKLDLRYRPFSMHTEFVALLVLLP
jgi:hypothetical protein